MTLKLVSRENEGELLLEGRLDSVSAPEAEAIFKDVSERFDVVILNMATMEYISSAGLRVVKNLHITMRKKGGELILRNVSKFVMEVFEMTGFAGLLHIE